MILSLLFFVGSLLAAIFEDFFVSETGETPDVPAEFLMGELGELETSLRLDERLATAKGQAGLALEFSQFVFDFFKVDKNSAAKIPSLGILATFTMVGAALRPDDGAEAGAIDDTVALDGAA